MTEPIGLSRTSRARRVAAKAPAGQLRFEHRLDRVRLAVHERGEDFRARGQWIAGGPAQVPAPEQLRGLAELLIVVGERAKYPLLLTDQGRAVDARDLLGQPEPHRRAAGALMPDGLCPGNGRADRVDDDVILTLGLGARLGGPEPGRPL